MSYTKECIAVVKKQLRAAKREKREMWRALCPNCKLFNENGAGRACLARNWQTPTIAKCPLLKKGIKR